MTYSTLAGSNSDEMSDDEPTLLKLGAARAAGRIRSTVAEKASTARDWAVDQGDEIRNVVQTRPFVSVGVSVASAFAAGLIVGIMLARR